MDCKTSNILALTSFILLSNQLQLIDGGEFKFYYNPNTQPTETDFVKSSGSKSLNSDPKYADPESLNSAIESSGSELPNIDVEFSSSESSDSGVVSQNGGELPTQVLIHHHYHPPIHAENSVHPVNAADNAKSEEFEQIKDGGLTLTESTGEIQDPVLPAFQNIQTFPGPESVMMLHEAEKYYTLPPGMDVPYKMHFVMPNQLPLLYYPVVNIPQVKVDEGIPYANRVGGLGLPSYNSYNNLLFISDQQFTHSQQG